MEENNTNMPVRKQVNPMAVASIILSVVGLIIAGIPCGIAAVITGIIGLVKFDSEKQKLKWIAIIGIIIGAADVILVAVALPGIMKNLGL